MRQEISETNVQAAYQLMSGVLEDAPLNRGELIAAIFCLLGNQYKGGTLTPEEMATFVEEAANWFSAYFAGGTKH